MEQPIKKLTALGASLLVLALLVMLPVGYFGKDVVSPWWFGCGFLIAWIGFALLSRGSGPLQSVGGGCLVACVVAVLGAGLGSLLTGHALRDLLYISPILGVALWLQRRAAKAEVHAAIAPSHQSPWVVLRLLLLTGAGFGILLVGLLHARLLDSYPYVLGGLVGASLGYTLFRLVKRAGATPYYALIFIAAPLGVTTSAIVNRYGDSSSPTDHTAQVLDFEGSRRGEDVCIVESWRGPWSERIGVSIVPCPVHGRIVVRTRAGALGWPWIESARID
jgi:hypothetical protein